MSEIQKKILITQSNYIPWKGYFDNINLVDEFIVFDDMQFTKRDWRNRNQIKTPQGLCWLTIPVEVKGKFFQKINETNVSDKKWGDKHWKSLVANYSRAPFFKTHKDMFEFLYRDESVVDLTSINIRFIKAINTILGIQTKIIDSRELTIIDGKTERLIDICLKREATHYFTGPAAKSYMDDQKFRDNNIFVQYFNYENYPLYPQLFGSFMHNVSILDLIFNTGDKAKHFMKTF